MKKLVLPLFCLFLIGCSIACSKKPDGQAAQQPAASPQAAAPPPAAAAPQPAAPPQPTVPVPTFSAAQKVGMYAFPKNNQSSDQQLIDELDCYNKAQQMSGVNPGMAKPVAPTQADIQAAQEQAAGSAGQAKGGRLRGAARAAAGGAVIGGIAGDAGTGAAAGAVAGTMVGGARQRNANNQAKQQAASSASAQMQENYNQELASYHQQIGSFKRAFSGCLDARGYSVK